MFKITNTWLMQHRTKNGAWTKKQAEILGLSWPFQSGWKRKISGNSITNSMRVNFESAAHITCKNKKSDLTIDKCIEYLCENKNSINSEQTNKLHNISTRHNCTWKNELKSKTRF